MCELLKSFCWVDIVTNHHVRAVYAFRFVFLHFFFFFLRSTCVLWLFYGFKNYTVGQMCMHLPLQYLLWYKQVSFMINLVSYTYFIDNSYWLLLRSCICLLKRIFRPTFIQYYHFTFLLFIHVAKLTCNLIHFFLKGFPLKSLLWYCSHKLSFSSL